MYMILDEKVNEKVIHGAEKSGFTPVLTKRICGIDPSVESHADMQAVRVGESLVVCPENYEYYRKMLPDADVICGRKKVCGKYPEYAAYNIALTSEYAIHRFDITDGEVLKKIESMKRINVKQGYSKCSVCALPHGIITADRGIAKETEKVMPTLLIETGGVELEGKEYGFLGGASGCFDGTLYFTGDITLHTDYEKIKNFCEKQGIEIHCLSNDKLADIGSIIII